jgi:hypothetical protein
VRAPKHRDRNNVSYDERPPALAFAARDVNSTLGTALASGPFYCFNRLGVEAFEAIIEELVAGGHDGERRGPR